MPILYRTEVLKRLGPTHDGQIPEVRDDGRAGAAKRNPPLEVGIELQNNPRATANNPPNDREGIGQTVRMKSSLQDPKVYSAVVIARSDAHEGRPSMPRTNPSGASSRNAHRAQRVH
jgi:hypothetical protein